MKKPSLRPPETLDVVPQRLQEMDISIPGIEYKVVAQPILNKVFTGNVTVIPTVLIFYLRNQELKIVATIIQETMECGVCSLNSKQFAVRNSMFIQTVYTVLNNLKKMGIVYEDRKGWEVLRAIDFEAVQHLNDLVAVEDRGVYIRLRKHAKFRNISKLTRKDVEKCYDLRILPPDHDIEEEEEYD